MFVSGRVFSSTKISHRCLSLPSQKQEKLVQMTEVQWRSDDLWYTVHGVIRGLCHPIKAVYSKIRGIHDISGKCRFLKYCNSPIKLRTLSNDDI